MNGMQGLKKFLISGVEMLPTYQPLLVSFVAIGATGRTIDPGRTEMTEHFIWCRLGRSIGVQTYNNDEETLGLNVLFNVVSQGG